MITLPSQLSMLSIPSIGLDFHSKGFGNEYKATFRISATRLKTTMVLPILATKKKVWVWTKNKDVMTASVERGWDTFIFTPDTHGLIKEWSELAKIRALVLEDGVIRDSENHQIGLFSEVSSAHELKDVEALVGQTDTVVMDALDWQIIPAENMVAVFQNSRTSLLATARTADEARVYIEALEKGTDGVVLQTENPMDVFELKAHFASNGEKTKDLSIATIHRMELMGLGDRVCVDLCNLLAPGEGLLVGSFAKGLFLVHSECLETNYIASRPFRVNAGPVHAYVEMPGGRTCYLSELCSGMEVLVTNNEGRQRRAIVGRVKIESRPLILIEAKVENSDILYSLLLQNAETVSLVKPSSSSGNGSGCAAPVTSLKVGDKVLLSVEEEGARHTGRKIQEFIVEK